MTPNKHTRLYLWESEMIAAFEDDQWNELLDPIYEKFQAWKAGSLSPDELNKALDHTYRERRDLDRLFYEKHDWLARVIPLNEAWFTNWLKSHPKPEEV